MNKTTERDLRELLGLIESMKQAFSTANKAVFNAEGGVGKSYLMFCESLGAVEGQARVLQIDLDVYERPCIALSGGEYHAPDCLPAAAKTEGD